MYICFESSIPIAYNVFGAYPDLTEYQSMIIIGVDDSYSRFIGNSGASERAIYRRGTGNRA